MAERGSCNFGDNCAILFFIILFLLLFFDVGISSAEDTFEKHQPDCVRRTKPPVQGGFIFAKTSKSVTHVCSHEYDIEGSKLYQAVKGGISSVENLWRIFDNCAILFFIICFFCCSWTGCFARDADVIE